MNFESFSQSVAFFSEFLDYLAKATPLALVLGGLLTYYYREKIKVVLARAVSRDLEEQKAKLAMELATHTAGLHRELEMYKVSLIAETERIKAEQDVRKSIALKVAERRFSAIARLLDVHMGLDTDIGALITSEQSFEKDDKIDFLKRKSELHERLSKYTEASDAAQIFISTELRGHVSAVRRAAYSALALRSGSETPKVPSDHKNIDTLLSASIGLETELKDLLSAFEKA